MRALWITSSDSPTESDIFAEIEPWTVVLACRAQDAIRSLAAEPFDAIVMNTPVADSSPDQVLEGLRRVNADVPILVRHHEPDLEEAVRLIKLGAFHFMLRSTPARELKALLKTAAEASKPALLRTSSVVGAAEPWRDLLVGESQAMLATIDMVRLLGPRKTTVMISGETGTGKELVAKALHLASGRAHMPMTAVNCSALPESLLEAELFGHVRGAFTGAVAHRAGRFEQANRGSIFLDEVADLPIEVQTKLLRVLQEREFQRLGSSETVRVDVRVIAACNVDLLERVRTGRFREDLYYRLNVVPLEIAPLRCRLEDIPLLVKHFMEKVARSEGIAQKQVTRDTIDRLRAYDWPGNVRQLENTVEMAMILSGTREVLFPSDFRLPAEVPVRRSNVMMMPQISVPDQGLDFEQTVGQIEHNILQQALHKTHGNKKQAAAMLGLKRTTLSAKLKSLEALVG